jgi:hypothetical protein
MDNYDIDKSKELVDRLFEQLSANTKDSKDFQGAIMDAAEKFSSESKTVTEFATAMAMEELEQIRAAFIEFQERVSSLMLYNYMTTPFEQFAEYASDLTEAINDHIDESKLTPDTLKKYKSIKKLRAQILANIYNKYKYKGGK